MTQVPTYFTGEHAISMTLRDYFACEAMCLQTWFTDTDNEYAAKRCYAIADAMIKQREESK